MCETLAPTMARWPAVRVLLRFSKGCSRELMPLLPGSSGLSSWTQLSCLSRPGVEGVSPGLRSSSMDVPRTELSESLVALFLETRRSLREVKDGLGVTMGVYKWTSQHYRRRMRDRC